MKLASALSALALAVLPCQAEKRMFNLTFYSVDQNRSIQYPVHENMGIGIIRTRVARKIVQRQPLTVLQYHNQSLFDIKTVKDYGLNEHSDPIFVLKRKSKAHIKLELKKEKARLKKEKERLQKEKKKQKAEEKARTEALKKAEKAMEKQKEEQNNMILIGGTAMQRSHWSDAERKAMAKLERKFAKIEKKLGEKRELAAAMRAKFERRRKNKQDPALLSRLEMALKKVETVDIPEVQKKQLKVRDRIVSLWEKAQENVERKAAQDLTALQASNATNATQQAEAVAHGKNFTKISYSANNTSDSSPSKYNGTNITLAYTTSEGSAAKYSGTDISSISRIFQSLPSKHKEAKPAQ